MQSRCEIKTKFGLLMGMHYIFDVDISHSGRHFVLVNHVPCRICFVCFSSIVKCVCMFCVCDIFWGWELPQLGPLAQRVFTTTDMRVC